MMCNLALRPLQATNLTPAGTDVVGWQTSVGCVRIADAVEPGGDLSFRAWTSAERFLKGSLIGSMLARTAASDDTSGLAFTWLLPR